MESARPWRALEGVELNYATGHPFSTDFVCVATVVVHDPENAIDESSLRAAALRLCEKHPTTRAVIDRAAKRFVFYTVDESPPQVNIEEPIHDLQATVKYISHLPYDTTKPGQFAIHMARTAVDEHRKVLLLRLHHVFCDGTGLLRLVHDLCSNLALVKELAMRAATPAPVIPLEPCAPLAASIRWRWLDKLAAWFAVKFLLGVMLGGHFRNFPLPVLKHDYPSPGDDLFTLLKSSPEMYKRVVEKCKEKNISVGVFFATCLYYSFAKNVNRIKGSIPMTRDGERMLLAVSCDYNMRPRVTPPVSNEHVLYFIGFADILREGVPLHTPFWELTRHIREAIFAPLNLSALENVMSGSLVAADPKTNRIIECMYDLSSSGATLGFCNLSSIGKYPYSLHHHSFTIEELYITNLHRIYCLIAYLVSVGDVFCFSAVGRSSVLMQQQLDDILTATRDLFDDPDILESSTGPTVSEYALLPSPAPSQKTGGKFGGDVRVAIAAAVGLCAVGIAFLIYVVKQS